MVTIVHIEIPLVLSNLREMDSTFFLNIPRIDFIIFSKFQIFKNCIIFLKLQIVKNLFGSVLCPFHHLKVSVISDLHISLEMKIINHHILYIEYP